MYWEFVLFQVPCQALSLSRYLRKSSQKTSLVKLINVNLFLKGCCTPRAQKVMFIGLQHQGAAWIVGGLSNDTASYEVSGGPNNWSQLKSISHHGSLFMYIVLVIMESHCQGIKRQMTKVHHLLALLIETQFSYLQNEANHSSCYPTQTLWGWHGWAEAGRQLLYSATTVCQVQC